MINRSPVVTAPEKYQTHGIFYSFFALRRLAERTRKTPVLPPARLAELGYKIAAYPLTLLSASTCAMKKALHALKAGESFDAIMDFKELQSVIGFPEYDETLKRLDG
jgi:2-methylisocitrate lyase-like PEP mutase family enzyme